MIDSLRLLGGLAAAIGLAGCMAQGAPGDPLSRIATWFSYANADDIRAGCRPGAPERLRLIVNAQWQEQVRTYDFVVPANEPPVLEARVFSGALLQFNVADFGDLGQSFGGTRTRVLVDSAAYQRVVAAARGAGLGAPTPRGEQLWSDTFYWLAAHCRDGQVTFQAWPERTEGRAAQALIPALQAVERNAPAFHRPPQVTVVRRGTGLASPDSDRHFDLWVGDNRLVTQRLF